MHMVLVCYVSFSRIGILTQTENGPGTGLSRGNEFYVIRAFETWSLVNQSQELMPTSTLTYTRDKKPSFLQTKFENCYRK